MFQIEHGHTHNRFGFPINAQGNFQPWLTYPLIEFLNSLDFTEKKIFEYGTGSSTLYWASRAEQVVSVELDEKWYSSLLQKIPNNVQLIHEPNGGKYPGIIQEKGKFDVIVIDGAERYQSAVAASEYLAPGGMIILDNSEWYPNAAGYLNSLGLIEVPFSGFSPINAFTSTSSVFMSRDFSIPKNDNARLPPIGGRKLPNPALDDVSDL